jgi:hypothetical protein
MLKQALEYIVDLSHPFVRVFNGFTYTDKPLTRVPEKLYAESIQTNTLTGLCGYIKSNVDDMDAKMLIHVVSPTKVRLLSALDEEKGRECLMEAHALVPEFTFGKFMFQEEFCIALQSKFINYGDRDLVLKFAGTVEDGTVTQYGDDGVTQKATVKTGLASKADAVVPNPVKLAPYRTFMEAEQPESDFIFRMREGVQCAVFEADGGAWKNQAMENVKAYLIEQLKEFGSQFAVIS